MSEAFLTITMKKESKQNETKHVSRFKRFSEKKTTVLYCFCGMVSIYVQQQFTQDSKYI